MVVNYEFTGTLLVQFTHVRRDLPSPTLKTKAVTNLMKHDTNEVIFTFWWIHICTIIPLGLSVVE